MTLPFLKEPMTERARLRIEISLLASMLGAGAGWGTFQYELGDLDKRLGRIEERVTAIYCAQVNQKIREACR